MGDRQFSEATDVASSAGWTGADDYYRSMFGDDVAKAARHLDRIKPDWWQRIDPLTLDIGDPCRCICGQNGLNWVVESAAADVRTGTLASPTATTELWLEEIARRMPSPDREPVPASATTPVGVSKGES